MNPGVPFHPGTDEHTCVDKTPNPEDWDQWLAAHAGRFLLYARERTGSTADAEDVLQDALVESWRRTPAGRTPDDALVYATIRRRAIDLGRSRDRRARREEKAAPESEAVWFACGVEQAETAALLERAVRALPEKQREIIGLKVWGELTFEEAARVAGVPPATAASRYRYALDELRKRLKGVLDL